MNTRSLTRAGPISAASRLRLAIDKQLPSVRAIGNPNLAFAAATRRSQHAAMPAPPPVQAPAIAAMVGTRHVSSALRIRSIRDS